MAVIKKNRTQSTADLVTALQKLIPLLLEEGEDDACNDLKGYCDQILSNPDDIKVIAANVIAAFEGEHELMDYTYHQDSKNDEWTAAQILSAASSKVLVTARRLAK